MTFQEFLYAAYKSMHTGEQIDQAIGQILNGYLAGLAAQAQASATAASGSAGDAMESAHSAEASAQAAGETAQYAAQLLEKHIQVGDESLAEELEPGMILFFIGEDTLTIGAQLNRVEEQLTAIQDAIGTSTSTLNSLVFGGGDDE